MIISTNPAKNFEVVGQVEESTPEDISQKVKAAQAAKHEWKNTPISERVTLLAKIRDEFVQRNEELAQLITAETGKPITQSRREVDRFQDEFNWYLNNASIALEPETTYEDDESIHQVHYEPTGVVAAITPWNFPYGMAVRAIVANLVVGNVVVFKISEECVMSGKFIEEVFSNNGLPEGVFSEVYGAGHVGEALAKSNIDMICFTGSTRTGKSLYKIAADKFIKVVLEMGGSNPCIVLEDADIEMAADLIYNGRFSNAGQVCSAIKRVIVHESIYDDLLNALLIQLQNKKVGSSTDEDTDIASLVAQRQVDLAKSQVEASLAQGAKIEVQIDIPDHLQGAFYPPTIMTNIGREMTVWKEEVFAPVLPIMKFETEKQAIEIANDTVYGLGARVITRDKERAARIARDLEAGSIELTEANRFRPENPFGGYKNSGMGRELGIVGLRELCQVKLVSATK